ncbi:MAG: hypothetical protein ACOCRO_08900, partial [Halanaerobiales bacterium]
MNYIDGEYPVMELDESQVLLKNLKVRHDQEIINLKEKLEYQKDKVLLEKEKELKKEIQSIRDEYNEKIAKLL